jgi:hypothetical protein
MQRSPVGSATFTCETNKGEVIMQTFKQTSTGHVQSSAILYEDRLRYLHINLQKSRSYTLFDVLQNAFETCDTSQMILVRYLSIDFKNFSSLCKFDRYGLKKILPDISSTVPSLSATIFLFCLPDLCL